MKKRKRISTAIIAVGVVASMMLAGCGSKYDDTSIDVTKIDVDKYIGNVGDYKNIAIETEAKTVVDDKAVQDYIDSVLISMGKVTAEVNRAAALGDVVNIDFEGFLDGVAFEKGKSEAYDLELGSGNFIPGFEDGLVGYSAGDNVDLNLTFPDNYQVASLAGQDVVFKVKINSVKESKAPELTEDMVVKFGIANVNTIDEFKAYIANSLTKAADDVYVNGRRAAALKKIYDTSEFLTEDVPQNLLNYYMTQVQSTDQQAADQYGVTLEQYVNGYYQKTLEAYEAECRVQATEMARDALICEKIARIENISLKDEDVEAQMIIDAEKYGLASVDEFKKIMDGDDYKNYLVEVRVADRILETATVTEIDYSKVTE